MRFFSFCSSPSKGNAYLIETPLTKIIVDAGFTKTLLHHGIQKHHIDIKEVKAVFLTHGHETHVKGMKFLLEIHPDIIVCANEETFRELAHLPIKNKKKIKPKEKIRIDTLSVTPIAVKHTKETLNFLFDYEQKRFAYITNTGTIEKELIDDIGKCEHFLIETYYNPGIARNLGSWEELKRIVTTDGHLTNEDAAEIVARCASKDIKSVHLCNISKFNDPNLSYLTIATLFDEQVNVQVVPECTISEWYELFPKPSFLHLIERLPKEEQEKLFDKLMKLS